MPPFDVPTATYRLQSSRAFIGHTVHGVRSGRLIDALSGIAVDACEHRIELDRALAELPVAVLYAER